MYSLDSYSVDFLQPYCLTFVAGVSLAFADGLRSSLEAYIAANFTLKVTLHATTRREGLIRARMFGAKKATGLVS